MSPYRAIKGVQPCESETTSHQCWPRELRYLLSPQRRRPKPIPFRLRRRLSPPPQWPPLSGRPVTAAASTAEAFGAIPASGTTAVTAARIAARMATAASPERGLFAVHHSTERASIRDRSCVRHNADADSCCGTEHLRTSALNAAVSGHGGRVRRRVPCRESTPTRAEPHRARCRRSRRPTRGAILTCSAAGMTGSCLFNAA